MMETEHKQFKDVVDEKTILEQLMRTIPALVNGHSLSHVLNTILRGVQASGFDRVRLYLLSEDKQLMVGHVQVGMDTNFEGFKMPIGNAHTPTLLADHRPHIFSTQAEHPVPYAEELDKLDLDEWADIPLIANGEMIGQISVDNKFSKQKIVLWQLEPVALFASQAAAAIENARLKEKREETIQIVQRQTCQLKVLHQISKRINSALNLNDILQAALENGLKAIEISEGSITLINRKTNKLEFKAWMVQGQFTIDANHHNSTLYRKIASRVAATEDVYNCPNILEDPYLTGVSLSQNTTSLLSVPIMSHGRVLGTINAAHEKTDFFSLEDEQFLLTLAEQVALALESQSLLDIGTLLSTLPLDEMLKKIVETAATLIGVDTSAIYLASEKPGDPIAPGEPMKAVKFPFDRGGNFVARNDGITHHVVKTGKPIIIDDAQNDPLPRVSAKTRGVQSMMAVPLKVRGRDERVKNIGALSADSHRKRKFSERDQELLESLAGQAAVAIAATIEHERSCRMTEKLLMLDRINVKMQSELSLSNLWDLISELAVELLDGDSGGILLLDETNQFLSFKGSYGLSSNMVEATQYEMERSKIGRVIKTKEAEIFRTTPSEDPIPSKKGFLSIASTPLWIDGEVIGVLNVHSKGDQYAFDEDKLQILSLMATQATVAIQNATLFEQLHKARNAARIVAEVTTLENLSDTLNSVVKGTIEAVGGDLATLYMYNANEGRLQHPPTMIGVQNRKRASHLTEVAESSIVYEMLEYDQLYIVNNIADDPRFKDTRFAREEQVRSCVVIPLQIQAEKVGVMFVNYRQPHRFSQNELTNMELFSLQAAVAIRNARLFDELKHTRSLVTARTAVAWLSAERASWQHKIVGHIGTIENYIRLLKKDLELGTPREKLQKRLSNIEQVIAKTREKKIAQPLSPEEGLEPVHVDHFIAQWLEKVYWDPALFPETPYELYSNSCGAYIFVHPGWFKLALDNIINNALNAMAESLRKKLTVATSLRDKMVEIIISDTGPGIPMEVLPKIFKDIVKKDQDGYGEGIGLLLSNMIIEIYEGEVSVLSTNSSGTSMAIRLPYGGI